MRPRSYTWYVVDRNVVMRRMTVDKLTQFTEQRGRTKTQHKYATAACFTQLTKFKS